MPLNIKRTTTGLGSFMLFVLLAIILVIFLTYPKYNDWYQGQQEIKTSSTKLAQINSDIATAKQEMSQMSDPGFAKIDTAIPSAASLGDLYAMIENLAGSSNVHLTSVQAVPEDSSTAAETINNAEISSSGTDNTPAPISTSQPPAGLGVISLNIEVLGDYSAIQQFLSNVYSSLRLIDIQTLTITGNAGSSQTNGNGNSADPTLDAKMQALTYYLLPQ